MTPTPADSDSIELGQVARTVARGWRIVALFTAAGIALAAAVLLFVPKRYSGTATVILRVGNSPMGAAGLLAQTGLGDLTSGLLGGKSQMDTELEIMTSRGIASALVDSLHLQARIVGEPRVAPRDALSSIEAPGSFRRIAASFRKTSGGGFEFDGPSGRGTMKPGVPLSLGPARMTFATGVNLPESFDLQVYDQQDAVDRVERRLGVDKGKGEVADVTFAADDSVTAAALPNMLLDIYFDRRRGVDRGVNQRNVEFLTAKSDSLSVELSQAMAALRRQQEQSGVIDPESQAKVQLEGGAALRAKRSEILVEQGALQQLMSQIQSHSLDPRQLAAYPTFLKSPAVNNMISQLADVQTQRTVMLGTRTASDPAVTALQASADSLEAQLVPYATTYASALAKERSDIEAQIRQVDDELMRLPPVAESGARLKLRIEQLAKLSSAMEGQLVSAKLAAITEGGDVRALDQAVVPKKPSFPKPAPTLAGGLAAGLLVGVIAALLIGSLGRWIRDPVEVERTTGVPTLTFDPAVPLLLANGASRTIVVAGIDDGLPLGPVVARLAQTAASRSITSAVFALTPTSSDVNASITRLEQEHDLVIVQLPSVTSDSAAAALQQGRPVLLVAPADRTDRHKLMNVMQLLRRLEMPVAGIVLSSRATLRGLDGAPALSPG